MPRIQINQKQKYTPIKLIIGRKDKPPKNKTPTKYLIKIILPYSARNKKAKPPLPYSILNPDTNSDSPSAKSNGVRLVSAKIDTSHIKKTGINIHTNQISNCTTLNLYNL